MDQHYTVIIENHDVLGTWERSTAVETYMQEVCDDCRAYQYRPLACCRIETPTERVW